MIKPLKLPKFKNEDDERDFWAKIDLSDYFEPSDMVPVSFSNLKPTSHPISRSVLRQQSKTAKEYVVY